MTFLDTGSVSSDAPPRNVASITAMTRKARGDSPGLRLVRGTIGLLDYADRFQQSGACCQAGLAHDGFTRDGSSP
jgi:hypothetical protein